MRILHVTDSHLGVAGPPVGPHRRADDHLRALREGLGPALRGEVDLVVHSGDLFDRSRPPGRAIAEAAALFAEVARVVPTLLMNGNHDWRGYRRVFPVPPAGLDVVDRPARRVFGDVVLALVPWAPDAARWAAHAREAVAGGADVLVAHQAFDGARVPGFTFRVGVQVDTVGPAHLPKGVRHVMCGHLHPRQRVGVGEACVVMPGSTERTAFSERDQTKGVALWSFGRSVEASFLDVAARPMVRITSRADLAAVVPGAMVRIDAADVDAAEVEARGAWCVDRPPRRAPPPPVPQLGLFGGNGRALEGQSPAVVGR